VIVKLKEHSIPALEKVITGDIPKGQDKSLVPYMTLAELSSFFKRFGVEGASTVSPSPSRWHYAQEMLRKLNGTESMTKVIEESLSPARFLDTGEQPDRAIEYLNRFLAFDGLSVVHAGMFARLSHMNESAVRSESSLTSDGSASQEFIQEQLRKCDEKMASGDYDGAITNARSLIEAVLFEVEGRLKADRSAYDGDLPKLYKRVQKLLNLSPGREDISDSLKSVLGGLASIVSGLAPLRNKMGDAHVRTHKPERHHAKLAVNSAKTLTDFIIDTLEYQERTGRLRQTDALARTTQA
jgi:hypothetical protein